MRHMLLKQNVVASPINSVGVELRPSFNQARTNLII